MVQHVIKSVMESNNVELHNVANDLISGLRIIENDIPYIVGDLAINQGVAPNKVLNASPSDLIYRILAKAGLLVSYLDSATPKTIVTGFPISTFQVNRLNAMNFFSNNYVSHLITYDPSTYSTKTAYKTVEVEVENVEIMREIEGCDIALRKGYRLADKNFFIVNIGYGTVESCLSTTSGIVNRTLYSGIGVRYALDLAMRDINKNYYLGSISEMHFDNLFQQGKVIANRKKIDITDIRKNSIRRYYNDIISPALRNSWRDDDFSKATQIFLCGGGALYDDMVDCFKEEFKDVIDLEIVDNPLGLVSLGYYLHALNITGNDRSEAIGLDIGNSHSVLTIDKNPQNEG